MQIAEQIKTLRLAQGISQETLAQHIGVSPQAVSRWETGATAPDISLLPSLAYYFQVSVDALIGYDFKLTEAALDEAFHAYFSVLSTDPSAAEAVLETALSRFPGNEQLELLRLYHLKGADSLRERIELCKRLSVSRHPTVRHEALCALAATYYRNHENTALREVLSQLPECEETKLSLSARFLSGRESLDAAQRQKHSSLSILLDMLQIISDRYLEQNQTEDARTLLLTAQRVLEAFREDVPFQFPKGDQPVQVFSQYAGEYAAIAQKLSALPLA